MLRKYMGARAWTALLAMAAASGSLLSLPAPATAFEYVTYPNSRARWFGEPTCASTGGSCTMSWVAFPSGGYTVCVGDDQGNSFCMDYQNSGVADEEPLACGPDGQGG